MRFRGFLSPLRQSLQGNRSARRAKKRPQRPRLTFYQPYLERLEDRIAPTVGSDLTALQGASGSVGNFASSLAAGPLNQSLPIVSGGTSTLSQILGVSSTFNTISTALNNINTNATTTNSAQALQNELGAGFTVTDFNNNNDGQIAVTYSQNVTATPSLSVATNPADFFGNSQATNYFSKITLSGSANGQFAAGSTFTITFGANGSGFFVSPGTIFSSSDFSASLSLSGTVNVGQIIFDTSLTGTGTIDLKNLNLSLTQQVSGADLSNIGSKATFNVDPTSSASVTADLKLNVLSFQLVDWNAMIPWTFASNGSSQVGSVSVPTSGVGAPSFSNQSSVQSALTGLLTNALGLSQFGAILDPLASAPQSIQDIVGFVTQILQGGLDDSSLDPEQVLNSTTSGGQFSFASASDLYSIVANGSKLPLITYDAKSSLFNIGPFTPTVTIPTPISILGLINFTFQAGAHVSFKGSAELDVGIDPSGVFVDTNKTNVTFTGSVGADVGLGVNVVGLSVASVTAGPNFTTSAVLGLNDTFNSDNKVYLSDLKTGLEQSQGLTGLGSWLSNALQLKVTSTGTIQLQVTVESPANGLVDALPGPVGDAVNAFIGAVGGAIDDFLTGAVEEVCDIVESIPLIGSAIASVANCHDVAKVAQLVFGDYLVVLDAVADKLGVEDPANEALGGGIQHTGVAPFLKGIYTWEFPVIATTKIFNGSQISAGGSQAANPNQSDPSDFIGYQVNGSTLTITGAAGTDNIRVQDLGNGQIELFRSGIDSNGTNRTDPSRIFSGITQINATMNDSSGTNDSFIMDPSLNINTTVTGGAGNEKIVTGAGDDTINAGGGNDDLEGGGGNNQINAGNGQDTLVGGSGTDYMKGGSGGDLFQAGSGTETMTGGSGNDTFMAGSGTDVAHGGGGSDVFQGGSGTATFYGEGGANDTDTFFGGSGSVTAYGGQGTNNYTAGSGTLTVHGGPGQDTVYWQVGDGNVTFDGGGTNSPSALDTIQLTGSAGSDTFTATANGTGVSIAAPGATISASNIQVLLIDGGPGADNTTIHDLSGTTLQAVGINFGEIGNADNALDTTTLYGPSATTVNISEITGTAQLTQPPQPSQQLQVTNVSGPAMQITGLGPTVVVPDGEDAVNVNPGGNNIVNINTQTMQGTLTVNGGTGVDQFNVQAVSGPTTINTTGGQNTINVGSKAPATGGTLGGIVAALTLNGSGGSDTANVDDTGDTSPQSGTLTPSTLTGLGMGPSGITYSGLSFLNIDLGSGGNTFTINVPSGANLPPTTTIDGGTGSNNSLSATFVQDMNGKLLLTDFEQSTIQVGGNLNGYLSDTSPGSVQLLSVGGSLTATGRVVVGSLDTLTIGQDLAGSLLDYGNLGTANIGNNLSGSLTVDGNATTVGVGADVSGLVDVVGSLTTLTIGGSLTGTGLVTVGQNLNTMSVGVNLAGQVLVGQALSYLTVGQDLSGFVSETGTMQQVVIGHSLTYTGIVDASNSSNPAAANIVLMTIGPNQFDPGYDMAGQIIVSGTLTLLRVAGGTPGTIVAGQVGQVQVYGGYGPLVSQIKENGIQRRVEAAVPSNPYPLPNPPGQQPPPNDLPNVFFQYIYEGTSGGLANPQLTVRVANNASTAPDQYDLSLVVYSDTAKFNLARLDAAGVSGIRNVAVEGNLLTSVSTAAANFLVGDNTPAGIRLPSDHLAGVAVRDYAPLGFIQAASIQAATFGSTTDEQGILVTGPTAMATDAEDLLAPGTLIVQASDTFRVPFADALPVAFFMDTQTSDHQFDSHDVVFTDQAANDARGAVTALVNVTVPLSPPNASTIQSIDMRGDGGAIQTQQAIVQRITSTGPLGDLILTAAGGLAANVTAPSIIGNIEVQGPIAGIIQTTGQRTDPITGLISTVSADWGTSTTVVQTQGGGITGQLVSRGNLLSQIEAAGGISGVIAVQGNLGGQNGSVRYGGVNLSNGSISGQVVVLGNVLGDIVAHGGLKDGRIAVEGSILGNTVLDGGIDAASALVAGGDIGNVTAGTGLTAGTVLGIVGANGNINLVGPNDTSNARFFKSYAKADFFKANLSIVDPTSAATIDSIFTSDLSGLALMLQNLEDLSVSSSGELVLI